MLVETCRISKLVPFAHMSDSMPFSIGHLYFLPNIKVMKCRVCQYTYYMTNEASGSDFMTARRKIMSGMHLLTSWYEVDAFCNICMNCGSGNDFRLDLIIDFSVGIYIYSTQIK